MLNKEEIIKIVEEIDLVRVVRRTFDMLSDNSLKIVKCILNVRNGYIYYCSSRFDFTAKNGIILFELQGNKEIVIRRILEQRGIDLKKIKQDKKEVNKMVKIVRDTFLEDVTLERIKERIEEYYRC